MLAHLKKGNFLYNSQKVVNTTSDGVIELTLRPGAKIVVTYLISNK